MTLYTNNWLSIISCLLMISSPFWPVIPDWSITLLLVIVAQLCCGFRYLHRIILTLIITLSIIQIQSDSVQRQSNCIFKSGEDITITVVVDSFFKQNSLGFSGTVTVIAVNSEKIGLLTQPKVRLYSPIALSPGDRARFNVRVKPIYGQLNEAGFDAESYYFGQKIVAKAMVDRQSSYFVIQADNLRTRVYRQVATLTEHLPFHGVLLALSFGERNGITDAEWLALRNSGLAHLVAISGLHIGIAYGLGHLVGLFLRRIHILLVWAPVIAGIAFASTYSWLAGFSLPTQRALIMVLINAFFLVATFRISLLQRVLYTLSVLLVVDPFCSISTSFWMSFLAVIFVFNQSDRFSSMRAGIIRSWLLQFGLVICMIPATAYFLGGFSLVAPFFNWVFIPLVSLVTVPLIFFALFATFAWPNLATYLWHWADLTLSPLLWGAQYANEFWLTSSSELLLFLILVVMIYLLSPILTWSFRLVLFSISAMVAFIPKPTEGWRIDVLDVGQGLSLLIEKDGRYVVYDTGSRWDGGSMVENVIGPVLKHRGVAKVDGLIISHIDNDHAGGRQLLDQQWHPEWRRSSQQLEGYLPCVAGEDWQWQGLNFDVLWPPAQVAVARNRYSCVVRVFDPIDNNSVILTGDVDALSEWLLIRREETIRSDVILVPHHGSRSSSSSGLIDAVQPMFALASLAKGNQWNMPNPQVVERYTERKAQWMDTGDEGQITVRFRLGQAEVTTQREQHGDSWYRQMLRKQVE